MSCSVSPSLPGATLFLTAALARRGADTLTRQVEALRVALRQTMAERPFVIDAGVVLPDHVHMIWTLPAGDSDYATRWDMIQSRFLAALPEGRAAGLWRPGVRARRVEDAAGRDRLTRWCWTDPVRHGLVSDPFDWPQSSIHRDGVRGMDVGGGRRNPAQGGEPAHPVATTDRTDVSAGRFAPPACDATRPPETTLPRGGAAEAGPVPPKAPAGRSR
ncbi:REP-associated tyrosine transposase [Roseicyclus persicicus]|uniref:REP-associated tyrosine transposase n=1 Tax=Roseicyclus persicicus TaxID=2650661 RepID=UPI003B847B8D